MAHIEDPFILMSTINMKLRDGDYETLEEVCDSLDMSREDVVKKLNEAGFSYMECIKQFR